MFSTQTPFMPFQKVFRFRCTPAALRGKLSSLMLGTLTTPKSFRHDLHSIARRPLNRSGTCLLLKTKLVILVPFQTDTSTMGNRRRRVLVFVVVASADDHPPPSLPLSSPVLLRLLHLLIHFNVLLLFYQLNRRLRCFQV